MTMPNDSHHDQVMRLRIAGEGHLPRRYFGYGTILDRAAFDEWRAQHGYEFFSLPDGLVAEALDVGLVYDFPLRWWAGRVAGLAAGWLAGLAVHGHVTEVSHVGGAGQRAPAPEI